MSRQTDNQYYGSKDFENMNVEEKILFRTSAFRPEEGKSAEKALSILKQRISEGQTGRNVEINPAVRIFRIASALAAVLLLIFGLWRVIYNSGRTSISSERGVQIDYTLSDGSVVKLNSDSKISFSKMDFTKNRQVELTGEAFFEVKKGNSFRVVASNGTVSVLGTNFNVFSRDNIFKVACYSGKVIVNSGKSSVTLDPGERAELGTEELVKFQDEKTKFITGWINGEFYFENTPLNLVFDEIERQYNVKFVGKDINEEYFTGSFVNKDLKTTLEIVCIPMGLEYEIRNNSKISVSKKQK